jgi:hypothetical protein
MSMRRLGFVCRVVCFMYDGISSGLHGFLRLLLVEAFESVEDLFTFTSAILVDLVVK